MRGLTWRAPQGQGKGVLRGGGRLLRGFGVHAGAVGGAPAGLRAHAAAPPRHRGPHCHVLRALVRAFHLSSTACAAYQSWLPMGCSLPAPHGSSNVRKCTYLEMHLDATIGLAQSMPLRMPCSAEFCHLPVSIAHLRGCIARVHPLQDAALFPAPPGSLSLQQPSQQCQLATLGR